MCKNALNVRYQRGKFCSIVPRFLLNSDLTNSGDELLVADGFDDPEVAGDVHELVELQPAALAASFLKPGLKIKIFLSQERFGLN